jgi:hypothetical protein
MREPDEADALSPANGAQLTAYQLEMGWHLSSRGNWTRRTPDGRTLTVFRSRFRPGRWCRSQADGSGAPTYGRWTYRSATKAVAAADWEEAAMSPDLEEGEEYRANREGKT